MSGRMIFAVALCAASFLGCADSSTPESPGDSMGSVEDHHGIPPYKPATFADAVGQLPRRFTEVLGQPEEASTPERRQELSDIVRWLPELAAETDLVRSDWEQVQQLAQQLERELAATPPNRERCEQLATALGEFAGRPDAASIPMVR